jgi:hypothetical protein
METIPLAERQLFGVGIVDLLPMPSVDVLTRFVAPRDSLTSLVPILSVRQCEEHTYTVCFKIANAGEEFWGLFAASATTKRHMPGTV